jgi:citrate synthase
MNMQLSKTPIGLDGIPAAETVLSHVDGERGELIIAGERVRPFPRWLEGVTARLWSGDGQPIGKPRCAAPARAATRLRRLPDLLGITYFNRRRFSRGRGLRAEAAAHEATVVGAFPVIAGALVQRTKGNDRSHDAAAMPPTRYR